MLQHPLIDKFMGTDSTAQAAQTAPNDAAVMEEKETTDHIDSASELVSELSEKVLSWWDHLVLMLPNVFLAMVLLFAFTMLGKVVKNVSVRLLGRVSDNIAVNRLTGTLVHLTILTLGVFSALDVLNLDKTVTSLLAGVGVVGLALGFAFQNTATNLVSGLFMATRYPMNVGDLVETNGYFATVEQVTLRYTTLRNFDGELIVIPNKSILEGPLVNYTERKERRVNLSVGVTYDADLEKVQRVVKEAIRTCVDFDRPVAVQYEAFGDSSINFVVRFWLPDSDHKRWLEARSDAVIAIKKAFDREGITIPFPIRTLEFNTPLQMHKNGGSAQKES